MKMLPVRSVRTSASRETALVRATSPVAAVTA
jgi:hypothetical protein